MHRKIPENFSCSRKGLSCGKLDKFCCCFPLECGLYFITICIFLTGLISIRTVFVSLSSNILESFLLNICMAPFILAAILVLLFWIIKDKQRPIEAIQCSLLSFILIFISCIFKCDPSTPTPIVMWEQALYFLIYFYFLSVAHRYNE